LAPAGASATELAPADSLYQLKDTWRTADGREVALADELRGGPVVVTMAYTRCTYTCPLIVKKLKAIDAATGHDPRLRFLLISFDTKKETPASMTTFLKEKELAPGRWRMVAGKTSGAVRKIAAMLEVSYKENANGEFSHSNVITLLDKDGRVLESVKGLAADHSALVEAVKRAP
jgi:protein SCO1/2